MRSLIIIFFTVGISFLIPVEAQETDRTPAPYLNREEDYIIGTGLVAMSAETNGVMTFITGPDYSSPNLIDSESMSIYINDKQYSLPVKMHRMHGTGLYYGVCAIGDLKITIFDHGYRGQPWIARSITVINKSASKNYRIRGKADLQLKKGPGRSDRILQDDHGQDAGISVCAGADLYSMFGDSSGWVKNNRNKYMTAAT